MVRAQSRLLVVGAMLSMLGLVVAGGRSGLAQDATPAAREAAAHPAHIHAGTCDNLDPAPAFPLTNVGKTGMMQGMTGGTPEADAPEMGMSEPMGAESAATVETSYTVVDAPLEEIVEGGHAINLHESAENIETYIACGDVGGRIATGPGMEQGGTLVVGLREVNGSGYSGVAVLEGMGDQTEVILYLAEGLSGETGGATDEEAEEGTPSAAGANEAAASEIAVDIQDFAYNPDPVEIPAGGAITWTNRDAAPHTATARDRDALQSGKLDQGESYSETLDEVGTYEYFCEFHPNMKGTVVVE